MHASAPCASRHRTRSQRPAPACACCRRRRCCWMRRRSCRRGRRHCHAGVGWSEMPRYSFRVPAGWEETPVSIADLGGTEVRRGRAAGRMGRSTATPAAGGVGSTCGDCRAACTTVGAVQAQPSSAFFGHHSCNLQCIVGAASRSRVHDHQCPSRCCCCFPAAPAARQIDLRFSRPDTGSLQVLVAVMLRCGRACCPCIADAVPLICPHTHRHTHSSIAHSRLSLPRARNCCHATRGRCRSSSLRCCALLTSASTQTCASTS